MRYETSSSDFESRRVVHVMSEYQYYEFQAIDRPLSEADRAALRAISTRARITATSLTNSYEWGDFKGDPQELMARCFDLHLYLANWGARRLMMRLPRRLVDGAALKVMLVPVEGADVRTAGNHLILDIWRNENGDGDWGNTSDDDWDDGSGWLGALAPLRADLLGGDLRLVHMLWLMAVQDGTVPDEAEEPLRSLGPLTGALRGFADFFGLDPDLVTAAAERDDIPLPDPKEDPAGLRRFIEALTEPDRLRLLTRLFEGDPYVMYEARSLLRAAETLPPRSAGALRARAADMRATRLREEARLKDAERRWLAEDAERTRRARLDAIERRGESVWSEIESEIARRNAPGYDRAAQLLHDLAVIAAEKGTTEAFGKRVTDIFERHARKQKFLERLKGIT